MPSVRGPARVGRRTKHLARRLRPGDVAVIAHRDLDELAARSLVRARVRAVINTQPSISGRYPCLGPGILAEAGVPLVDCPPGTLDAIADGDPVEVEGGLVRVRGREVAWGQPLTPAEIGARLEAARANVARELERFIANTMAHAGREMALVLDGLRPPPLRTRFFGRPALVVARGHDFREDLEAVLHFAREERPVLVGVDGGADAMLEFGLAPDLIVGDMDSVSDRALRSGAELVVHAYAGGAAPGLRRVRALELPAHTVPCPGTSEDLALLLAYESGARLIVAVGAHSHFLDFLEKGRAGMGSTFLVRAKVGPILVDARGASQLYRGRLRPAHVLPVLAAGLLPAAVVILLSPATRGLLRLLAIELRLGLGW